MVVDAQFYEGKNLDIVNQVETIGSYGGSIIDDYGAFTAANAMVEVAERLTMEESSPQQYLLLVGALRSLATKEHDSSLILDSYLLRALAIAGWAPSFDDCARCDAKGPHSTFVMQVGSVVCQECKPIGAVSMSIETTELLGALLSGDWELADKSTPGARANASGIVAAYSQWHIERSLKSMPHVERA
jgi:DNA repair protein RecO (recombination protein O)